MTELNKMTGYALTGLSVDNDGHLADPRVNAASPLLTGSATLTDFLAGLTGMDAAMHRDRGLAEDEPCRAVVHDGLDGIPGVLIVRPVWLPSWHRVGDVMDRAGELGVPDAVAGRLEVLPAGLWPFSGQFMDADTGAELHGAINSWVHATYRSPAGVSLVDGLDERARDALAVATTGFASYAEASARVVPSVPSAIRALLAWGELFTDPGTIAQMRPALYTWWA